MQSYDDKDHHKIKIGSLITRVDVPGARSLSEWRAIKEVQRTFLYTGVFAPQKHKIM